MTAKIEFSKGLFNDTLKDSCCLALREFVSANFGVQYLAKDSYYVEQGLMDVPGWYIVYDGWTK